MSLFKSIRQIKFYVNDQTSVRKNGLITRSISILISVISFSIEIAIKE